MSDRSTPPGMAARAIGRSNARATSSNRSSAGVAATASSSRHQIATVRPSPAVRRSTSSSGDQSARGGATAGWGGLRASSSTRATASFGAVEPDLRSRRRPARKLHPDAFGEGRGRELGFRQKPGEAERGETFGAQALLGLVAGLERHQHGRDPGAQKIDGGVVAGLAHRDRGSRQQRPEVRTGALDGDMGGRGAAQILERRLRDAGADDDAPGALRHRRGGSERRAIERQARRARSARDQDLASLSRRRLGDGLAALVDIAGVADERRRLAAQGPRALETDEIPDRHARARRRRARRGGGAPPRSARISPDRRGCPAPRRRSAAAARRRAPRRRAP